MSVSSGNSEKDSAATPGWNGSWENRAGIQPLLRNRNWVLWTTLFLIFLGLVGLISFGYDEVIEIQKLAQKRESMMHFNQELMDKNQEMYREIYRLKHDPLYIEEVARREFGLVKPDEIILFLEEDYQKEAKKDARTPVPNQQP